MSMNKTKSQGVRAARTTHDPVKLVKFLRSPWEDVRAAAVLNPATPTDAVRSLAERPRSGPHLLSALALTPALTSEERLEIYGRAIDLLENDRLGDRYWLFWRRLDDRLIELAHYSRSAAVLQALSRSTPHRVMHEVACNRYADAATRETLRHWSVPLRIRLVTFLPGRRVALPETIWTMELAGAVVTANELSSRARTPHVS